MIANLLARGRSGQKKLFRPFRWMGRASAFLTFMCLGAGCAYMTTAFVPSTLDQRIKSSRAHWRESSSASQPMSIEGKQVGYSQNLQKDLDRLIQVSPLQGSQIKVYVIEDNTVNAFTEGTSIYMNSGLLKLTGGNENQISTVMAHELGHIIANHVRSQTTRNIVGSMVPVLFQKMQAKPTTQLIAGELMQLGGAAYSREEEKEADTIGTVLAYRAGFDPLALIDFFSLIEPQQGKTGLSDFSSSIATHLVQYNLAMKRYSDNIEEFRQTGLPEANKTALHWKTVAEQEKSAANTALAEFKQYLSLASPWYRSHPPSNERKDTIRWVVERTQGKMTDEELGQKSKRVAETYKAIEVFLPEK